MTDINQYNDGHQLVTISGVIGSIYPERTGTGPYGDYKFQDVMLNTPSGLIKMSLSNSNTPLTVGDNVTINAKEGRDGLSGIRVASYNGKKFLKITPSAALIINNKGEVTLAPQQTKTSSPVASGKMTVDEFYGCIWDGIDKFKNDPDCKDPYDNGIRSGISIAIGHQQGRIDATTIWKKTIEKTLSEEVPGW